MCKQVCVALCGVVMALTPLAASAAEPGETRLYECMRVKEPPVIDGALNDACWQQAAKTNAFVRVMRGPDQVEQTSFQVAYDDAHLYLAVTCLESSPQAVKATVKTDDVANVMGSDDSLEIFIRPDLIRPDYYQFAANTIGTRYDARGFDPSWSSHWQAAATVGAEAWYLECAFDFASLGRFGVPGVVWGFNVCRDRYAGGDTDWSSWSFTPTGFHAPDRFGQLIFGGQPGSGDRAVLIECARYARLSIDLEGKINEALATIRSGDLGKLGAEDKARLQGQIDAADRSLKGLRDLLAQPSILDTRAWVRVTADLAKAAEDLDEAAWVVRFEKLLADD